MVLSVVGADVKEGDIMIGKDYSKRRKLILLPKKNLLRAIFGDKAGDVKNASLKAPPSMRGVVVE